MDEQRLVIAGRVWAASDPQIQEALSHVHDTPERPRCLCVPGGVEMYVARHREYVVKRMPETGSRHAPSCPSYEPDAQQSGLGELLGEAVREREPGRVELMVDFPWTRTAGRGGASGVPREAGDVGAARRRMSLRALMHYLFERAGFNRWSPAMEGRRHQGVLHKYLLEAAQGVTVKGLALSDRLFVPERFSEADRAGAARRRRDKWSVLNPCDGQLPLAALLGEFKASEPCVSGRRVWIKHLPDVPLLMQDSTWARVAKRYAALFEMRDADAGQGVRIVMAALLRARREQTFEIDTASLMLTDARWIPADGEPDLLLLQALVEQGRRFIKPLRYDARKASAFPNALLLDAGDAPVPLHALSAFAAPAELKAKEQAVAKAGAGVWVWHTATAMPPFPPAILRGRSPADAAG